MNESDTRAFLDRLFDGVDEAPPLFGQAMTRAAVPDLDGNPPLHPQWEPTYDEWAAAAEVAELLALKSAIGSVTQPGAVTKVSSEGTSFDFGPTPSWSEVAAHLRSRSRHHAPYGFITVDSGAPPFHPRSEPWGPAW